MDAEEKADALYTFTKESLEKLLDAGVDVGMVQIGNEINYGMAGETSETAIHTLLKAGSKAVREVSEAYGKDIRVVVHYTNITETGELYRLVNRLETGGIDYDMIGLSYYPFWNGSLENMQQVITKIRENYGKEVIIAETSYCYTLEDGDGSGNSLSDAALLVDGYPATIQGQEDMIRDVIAAASEAGALRFRRISAAFSEDVSISERWNRIQREPVRCYWSGPCRLRLRNINLVYLCHIAYNGRDEPGKRENSCGGMREGRTTCIHFSHRSDTASWIRTGSFPSPPSWTTFRTAPPFIQRHWAWESIIWIVWACSG